MAFLAEVNPLDLSNFLLLAAVPSENVEKMVPQHTATMFVSLILHEGRFLRPGLFAEAESPDFARVEPFTFVRVKVIVRAASY